jgi:hypothetical protein
MLPEKKSPGHGFPDCVSLTVTFNDHAISYQTAAQWWHDEEQSECPPEWPSEEEKRKALETNSVWLCYWNPDTPVGSCVVAAASFETLMMHVNSASIG